MRNPIVAAVSAAFAMLALAAAAGAQTPAPSPYAGGDAAAGRRFASEACTPCHVVAAGQRSPPRFATAPDFRAIANTRAMTATALAAFLHSPHPTMPNLILNDEEARDVISYILSLRDRG